MVNTRILEERLGWGRGEKRPASDNLTEAEKVVQLPEMRSIGHEPLLQGRVAATRSASPQGMQRSDADTIWQAMPRAATSIDSLRARRGALHAMDKDSAAAVMIDQLRGQLLRVVKARRWRLIGITSPQRGSGSTFVATGLAASVARIASMRVLLLDMDLTAPSLAKRLDLPPSPHFSDVLEGAEPPETLLQRIGDNLAVMANDAPVANASELVLGRTIDTMLQGLAATTTPDLILVDLPPLREAGIASALLPRLDAVLLVADGTRTTARDITESERMLDNQVPLMGVVLNKSEDRIERRRR